MVLLRRFLKSVSVLMSTVFLSLFIVKNYCLAQDGCRMENQFVTESADREAVGEPPLSKGDIENTPNKSVDGSFKDKSKMLNFFIKVLKIPFVLYTAWCYFFGTVGLMKIIYVVKCYYDLEKRWVAWTDKFNKLSNAEDFGWLRNEIIDIELKLESANFTTKQEIQNLMRKCQGYKRTYDECANLEDIRITLGKICRKCKD